MQSFRPAQRYAVLAALISMLLVTSEVPANAAVAAATLPALPAQDTSPTYSVALGGSIQTAVDQAATAGGGTVVLASGTHVLTNPIVLRNRVSIQGQGSTGTGTTLRNGLGTNMVIMLDGRAGGLTDVVFKSVKIDCALSAAQRSYTADPGKNYGVVVTDEVAANSRVMFDDVQVAACAFGVHVKGTTDLTVRNSNIHDNGGWPFYFHNLYVRRVSRVDVQNNTLTGSSGGNGVNISYSDNVTVRDCTLSDNYLRGVRAAESSYLDVLHSTVAGNGETGIIMNSEANGMHHFRIIGNTVTGNSVGIATSANSSDGEVSENSVSGNGTNLDIKSSATTVD